VVVIYDSATFLIQIVLKFKFYIRGIVGRVLLLCKRAQSDRFDHVVASGERLRKWVVNMSDWSVSGCGMEDKDVSCISCVNPLKCGGGLSDIEDLLYSPPPSGGVVGNMSVHGVRFDIMSGGWLSYASVWVLQYP